MQLRHPRVSTESGKYIDKELVEEGDGKGDEKFNEKKGNRRVTRKHDSEKQNMENINDKKGFR
jgi:hypothetical protein